MRRLLVFAVVLGLGACFGYERPKARSRDAIGAPADDVGAAGLRVERRGATPVASREEAPIWGPAREKFTEVAKVRKRSADHVTLERSTGDRVVLKVLPLTRITIRGRPASASALPEGAEVRASYVIDDAGKLAERIEVLQKGR